MTLISDTKPQIQVDRSLSMTDDRDDYTEPGKGQGPKHEPGCLGCSRTDWGKTKAT